MGSPDSPSLSPPHLYPEELQLKLYQAFIFSIPILFSIILFLLFYLFYLKRSASTTYSATTPPNFPRTLNQATSPAPTHFDTDLKLKGDLKIVFFDDYLKTKDSLCCVCLGEFQMEEELLQVPSCKHVFHTDCIRHWLLHSNSTTCPLCRSSIYLSAAYDPQPSTFHPNPGRHQDDNDQVLTITITNTNTNTNR